MATTARPMTLDSTTWALIVAMLLVLVAIGALLLK